MKIDFFGRYENVSRLVKASARPTEAPEGEGVFAKLLSSISPQAKQALEKNEDSSSGRAAPGSRISNQSEPMASLRLTPPEPKRPELHPISVPLDELDSDGGPPGSVKSPTVLDVRRVPKQPPFSDLKKSDRIDAVSLMVAEEGKKHGIDPALSMAVVQSESNYNSNAVSRDGHFSKGLFQLLDSTGRDLHESSGLEESYDPFNPDQNVELGIRYLRKLHDIFNRSTDLPNNLMTVPAANSSSLEKLAVAAFNAGEGRVASAQQRAQAAGRNPGEYDQLAEYLPESTQNYVARVMGLRQKFEADFSG